MKRNASDNGSFWKSVGQIWDISWMSVAPILFGLFLGQYLDRKYPLGFSWTLSLLALGAFLGFYNLYDFLMRESRKSDDKRDTVNHKDD
ncbi:AtpZ/AtpI family protein [Atrimonas thermophila]|uniref:AtpZ/AtpI family protein n=1 Tax=Atrimonas thermophila TaxID=3064161 RepID=UPI00399C6C25